MISRSRSAPTAAAMSIECTTSANSTVPCLYSAGVGAVAMAAPHSLQNFEFGGSSVPHDPHTTAAAVMSRGHPTGVHVDIVSPLASQHVPYRRWGPADGWPLRRASWRGWLGSDSADVPGSGGSGVRFCAGVGRGTTFGGRHFFCSAILRDLPVGG